MKIERIVRDYVIKSITFYWPTNALNCLKLKG